MADVPPQALTNLVQAIQSLGIQLNSILAAIKALQATLGPTYATGTWTPALQFGGASTGITYTTQSGTYTQLGREIICRFKIVLTSKGSATGSATIGGLPFAANADATGAGNGGMAPNYANMASLTETPVLSVAPSASAASLLTFGAAASAALTDANFTNTTTISGQFSYFT